MAERPGTKTKTRKQPGIPARSRKDVWYKLDLSAIVYPTLQRRDFSSVYRLSVVLKEKIDPVLLQTALDRTLPRFPTYKLAIRKGLFWRYLEPNNRPGPYVLEDIKNPCMPMPFKGSNRYLIRVYYYDRRISLEAHHSLGDGTGGMCLLQTLTAVYLGLLGHPVKPEGFVLDIDSAPDPEELEDAYMRYANAQFCPPRPAEKTYRVRGTKEPFYTLNIIDGVLSVQEVMAVAKRYHASITEYLNAVLLYAASFPRRRCAISSPWYILPSTPGSVSINLKKSWSTSTITCVIISTINSCGAISPPTPPPSATR